MNPFKRALTTMYRLKQNKKTNKNTHHHHKKKSTTFIYRGNGQLEDENDM